MIINLNKEESNTIIFPKQNKNFSKELSKIKKCCTLASRYGIEIHAGHGLDYKTTKSLSESIK